MTPFVNRTEYIVEENFSNVQPLPITHHILMCSNMQVENKCTVKMHSDKLVKQNKYCSLM